MRVILNKDYSTLGEEGDTVEVKSGYARNFLFPQGIAVPNTREYQAYFKARSKAIEKRKEEKRLASRSLKEKLENYEVKLVLPTGENGKLFGGVTALMLQDYLLKDGIEVERKKIEVPSHTIKTVGHYTFKVSLYGGEEASVKLIVDAEEKKEDKKSDKKRRAPKKEEVEEVEASESESQDNTEATAESEN